MFNPTGNRTLKPLHFRHFLQENAGNLQLRGYLDAMGQVIASNGAPLISNLTERHR